MPVEMLFLVRNTVSSFKGVQFQGNPALSLSQVLAITSLSVMLAAVIPSPAGIGSTEFVFTTLFAGIVGTGIAGSASLLYRFGTFVFPFLVGAVVVLVRHFKRKKYLQEAYEKISCNLKVNIVI